MYETIAKAKAYDEALKMCKEYLESLSSDKAVCDFLVSMFPELKEFRNEKIRKALMSYFASRDENEVFLNGITMGSIVSWLEEQWHAGKKWISEDTYYKEKAQIYQDGIDEVLENPQKFGLEKQGEQKPAEWSEEDKNKFNRIYILIAEAADEHAFGTTKRLIGDKEAVELQDFLKSIRPHEQQWSKEDEEELNKIMKHFGWTGDYRFTKEDCEQAQSWLKTLKYRVLPG